MKDLRTIQARAQWEVHINLNSSLNQTFRTSKMIPMCTKRSVSNAKIETVRLVLNKLFKMVAYHWIQYLVQVICKKKKRKLQEVWPESNNQVSRTTPNLSNQASLIKILMHISCLMHSSWRYKLSSILNLQGQVLIQHALSLLIN